MRAAASPVGGKSGTGSAPSLSESYRDGDKERFRFPCCSEGGEAFLLRCLACWRARNLSTRADVSASVSGAVLVYINKHEKPFKRNSTEKAEIRPPVTLFVNVHIDISSFDKFHSSNMLHALRNRCPTHSNAQERCGCRMRHQCRRHVQCQRQRRRRPMPMSTLASISPTLMPMPTSNPPAKAGVGTKVRTNFGHSIDVDVGATTDATVKSMFTVNPMLMPTLTATTVMPKLMPWCGVDCFAEDCITPVDPTSH